MDNATRVAHLRKRAENFPFDTFCREHAIFGDVHECIDRLQAVCEAFGLFQIICRLDQGCMLPVEEVKRTMAQFTDEVMPKISNS